MRKIDHTKAYTPEDIEFLRMAGAPYMEDWIAQNAKTHKYDVPDGKTTDNGTPLEVKPVVGEDAAGEPVVTLDPNTGAPRLVDPTGGVVPEDQADEYDYGYDQWKVAELDSEVQARNKLEDRKTDVVVVGTGKDGNVTKADLIKALRLWDAENVGVLSDEDENSDEA